MSSIDVMKDVRYGRKRVGITGNGDYKASAVATYQNKKMAIEGRGPSAQAALDALYEAVRERLRDN